MILILIITGHPWTKQTASTAAVLLTFVIIHNDKVNDKTQHEPNNTCYKTYLSVEKKLIFLILVLGFKLEVLLLKSPCTSQLLCVAECSCWLKL